MTPAEHLEALRALCEKLEPDLTNAIEYSEHWAHDDLVTLACKLFDAIKDPEECKP
jgi:hypothetical protein